jgi:drug/metabolite transporter (DMT)-like permease
MAAFLSSMLYVILKYFQEWKINNLHGLTFNYITASTLALGFAHHANSPVISGIRDNGGIAFFIGSLFIIVFYTAALTAQKAGVAITSIAGKMSMVIPIAAGVLVFGDHLYQTRIIGISLALLAVYLTSAGHKEATKHHSGYIWVYPILLFLGSGIVDTSIKISQAWFIKGGNNDVFFGMLFGSAGIIGSILTLYHLIFKRLKIELRSVLAGIFLGTVNYYSLVFLVRCLASQGAESVLIFSIVNMLVVVISALAAFLLFKEHPTKSNLMGIGLALLSILILSH